MQTTSNAKILISLEQFNRRKEEIFQEVFKVRNAPNGIACPDCGSELMDTYGGFVALSVPPKRAVHCPICNFNSFRLS